jgi:hypothetical protein
VFLPLRGVPTPVPSDRARRPWPDASAQSLRGRVRDHKARAPPRMAVRGAHRARRGRAHGLHPAAKPRTPLERKGAREPVPPPPTQWRGTGDRDAGRLAADTVAGNGLTALRRRRRAPHGDRRRGHGCPAGPVSWWSPGPSRSCLRSSGLSTLVAMGHAPVPMVVAWCATGVGNLSYVTVAVAVAPPTMSRTGHVCGGSARRERSSSAAPCRLVMRGCCCVCAGAEQDLYQPVLSAETRDKQWENQGIQARSMGRTAPCSSAL